MQVPVQTVHAIYTHNSTFITNSPGLLHVSTDAHTATPHRHVCARNSTRGEPASTERRNGRRRATTTPLFPSHPLDITRTKAGSHQALPLVSWLERHHSHPPRCAPRTARAPRWESPARPLATYGRGAMLGFYKCQCTPSMTHTYTTALSSLIHPMACMLPLTYTHSQRSRLCLLFSRPPSGAAA